jgi:hypothetical protein
MNLLFVTDLAPRIAQIAELIDAIDRASRQVRIEARIVEGEQGFSRNLGARVALRAHGRAPAADGAAAATDTRNALDLTARAIGGFDAATAGFTLFAAPLSRVLDIELSALEARAARSFQAARGDGRSREGDRRTGFRGAVPGKGRQRRERRAVPPRDAGSSRSSRRSRPTGASCSTST